MRSIPIISKNKEARETCTKCTIFVKFLQKRKEKFSIISRFTLTCQCGILKWSTNMLGML